MRYLLTPLLLLFSACTSIDYGNHVAGWPTLREEIHVVSTNEMHAACSKYDGFMMVALACSEYYLDDGICKIWVTDGGGWAEKHERGHCEGYDHQGSNELRDIFVKWKKGHL